MNSICVVCGRNFEQHDKYVRKTCSKACKDTLITKSNLHGRPPKPPKPVREKPPKELKPPRSPKTEPQRKLTEKKTVRSSFTDDELGIAHNIFGRLKGFPSCSCEHPEKTMLFSLTGSGVHASCSVCGFSATSCSGSWGGS